MTRRHLEQIKAKEDLTCNVIPLIDIMFLMLLFLMVGADMGQREMAELVLAKASHATVPPKEGDFKKEGERQRIVNVQFDGDIEKSGDIRNTRDNGRWVYVVGGLNFTAATLKERLELEAKENMEEEVDPEAKVILSRLKIVVRADKDAPYGLVQNLITICGQIGVYKIEIAAAKPEDALDNPPPIGG
jgi:biopolymer transport protein ExbD